MPRVICRASDSRQVQSRALAGGGAVGGGVVDLDAAHARALSQGEDLNLGFLFHRPRDQRPGDDGSKSLHHEGAVDGEPEGQVGGFGRRLQAQPPQFVLELIQPFAGARAHGHHRRTRQERTRDKFLHLQPHQVQHLAVHQVGLGDDDQAAANSQQLADVEVLARLRFDGLVAGDDQHDQIDAAHARQHVLHKALVAGNVDESDAQILAQIQMSEPQIDGDAAALLFLPAVGVGAGERQNQRRLSVVNVAGRSNDDVAHKIGDKWQWQ